MNKERPESKTGIRKGKTTYALKIENEAGKLKK